MPVIELSSDVSSSRRTLPTVRATSASTCERTTPDVKSFVPLPPAVAIALRTRESKLSPIRRSTCVNPLRPFSRLLGNTLIALP